MKEKYIVWNDGMGITAMGKLSEKRLDGTYIVVNPCTVVFGIANEELPGQENIAPENRKVRGVLRFDIQPYLFNALVKNGDKVEQEWAIVPRAVLNDNVEINDELINAYLRTVAVSSKQG